MLPPEGDGQPAEHQTLGHFALVSYLPDPLARFLDALRLELTPGCVSRAHVTILPPRPLRENLKTVISQIALESLTVPAFRVDLSGIGIFEGSNVVYIEIGQGSKQLRDYYNLLNHGPLEYKENFPYHPHITLAQNISAEHASELAAIAREHWAGYRGPRGFTVSSLSFVQHVAPSIWTDVAEIHTGIEVAVGR